MTAAFIAAIGGKQPNGRFRPGIVHRPYAEHDMAHYVIDAFGAALVRSGGRPYLEYDPEVTPAGGASIANHHHPAVADMVAFAEGRQGGVRVEVAPATSDTNREAASEATARLAESCGVADLGVHDSTRPWLVESDAPAWWVEVACLDDDADRAALGRPHFLRLAGEGLAVARCRFLGLEYRGPDEGSVLAPGAPRSRPPTCTGWFKSNHPTIALGAGCHGEPSDPTAHLQTMLGVLVDGRFGNITQMAVQALQRRFVLDDDGVCGPATWAVVHAEEREGSVGYTTKEIQRELGIADDGVFGAVTAACVEAFQLDRDTAADGRLTAHHYRLFLQ